MPQSVLVSFISGDVFVCNKYVCILSDAREHNNGHNCHSKNAFSAIVGKWGFGQNMHSCVIRNAYRWSAQSLLLPAALLSIWVIEIENASFSEAAELAFELRMGSFNQRIFGGQDPKMNELLHATLALVAVQPKALGTISRRTHEKYTAPMRSNK